MRAYSVLVIAMLMPAVSLAAEANLVEDGSFELAKPADQFGLVFQKWQGWKYEGDCEFRVGDVAHSGRTSCLLAGGGACKIRVRAPERVLGPGRYRITAYIRGLDISPGQWNQATEFMFDEKYLPLGKTGTFGWTRLTYVAEVDKERKVTGPSFGLMGAGFFWIDDVSMEKAGSDAAPTGVPLLGEEEKPIVPPGDIPGAKAVRCAVCGYRNDVSWGRCYACGAELKAAAKTAAGGPKVKSIASFEDGKSPFSPGTIVAEHATDGKAALKVVSGYVSMDTNQDWSGCDYLKADVYNAGDDPAEFSIEVRDAQTKDYWTRVNYATVAPQGQSTVIMPAAIYVGEKSRPGRPLDRAHVTRLVFAIPQDAKAPVFIDNVRLERDTSAEEASFEGLNAFDFGTETSPLMEGFVRVTPATAYSKGRGYGLKDAKVWRAYDVLQPEPLYQDFVCIESGGFAIDVPNGKYHVFVNIDNPSGYWGEYQRYRERKILAEGKEVAKDTMSFESFKAKYYRHWNTEDSPEDNTFDKYQEPYYNEKAFDVEVEDGQLNVDFQGENWSVSLSALVAYPAAKAAEGKRFLDYVVAKRRFHFDNYFKRVLHKPTGGGELAASDKPRKMVVFARDYMEDVYYNDGPRPGEAVSRLRGAAFAGEYEPVVFAVYPVERLGMVTVDVSDLVCEAGTIPASAINVAYASNRLSRVTMEGSVYTIAPRLLMPGAAADMSDGNTRWWWLTARVPPDAAPGLYMGTVRVSAAASGQVILPLEFMVHEGTLDPVDIPAGPWGYSIDIPWIDGDPATAKWNAELARKSLAKLREYGFTSLSGMPVVRYRGFEGGQPQFDFTTGDAQMKLAREAGFMMPVVNYCPFGGLDLYYQDLEAMKAAGFTDYSAFVKAVFSAVEKHAEEAGWLPVYWNLGDEPVGDDLARSAENAAAYRKAFPSGPPFFTAATSFSGGDPSDPHLKLAGNLHAANLNTHDEASLALIGKAGAGWAFYNGGNRWTFGTYMYKAAKEFDMKFRLAWHWNNVAGDPYYALDCREDDYAWCNTSPDGTLIPSIEFERLREGLDDYRYLVTLARLAKEKKGTPAAVEAENLIKERMASFKLGQRDHDALFGAGDWQQFRQKVAMSIEALRQ